MTKQERVQEAYGEHWETVKDYVDENGNFSKVDLLISGLKYHELSSISFSHDVSTFRPTLLQGIENNNGWTKIESEDDLPTDKTTQYSTCKDKKVFQSTVNCGTVKHWFYIGKITHYQPIQKQQPPIY